MFKFMFWIVSIRRREILAEVAMRDDWLDQYRDSVQRLGFDRLEWDWVA